MESLPRAIPFDSSCISVRRRRQEKLFDASAKLLASCWLMRGVGV